eukprot:jgi/Chlat1/571/Chrsp103S08604
MPGIPAAAAAAPDTGPSSGTRRSPVFLWGGGAQELLLSSSSSAAEDRGDSSVTWRRASWAAPTPAQRRLAHDTAHAYANLKRTLAAAASSSFSSDEPRRRAAAVKEYARAVGDALGAAPEPQVLPSEDEDNQQKEEKDEEAEKGDEELGRLRAAWELLRICFLTDYVCDDTRSYGLAETLLTWIRRNHAALLGEGGGTCATLLREVRPWLHASQAPEEHEVYWRCFAALVAQGWIDQALELLKFHSSHVHERRFTNPVARAQLEAVEGVSLLLERMPRASGDPAQQQAFNYARAQWLAECRKLLHDEYNTVAWDACNAATARGLRTALRVMLGEDHTAEDLAKGWLERLSVKLKHVKPHARGLSEARVLAGECARAVIEEGSEEALSHPLDALVAAALARDVSATVSACSQALGAWGLPHVVPMLPPLERDTVAPLEETYVTNYALSLFAHAATWQLGAQYLALAGSEQCTHILAAALERVAVQNPDDDLLAMKVLHVARQSELQSVVKSVSLGVGTRKWQRGMRGDAIGWLRAAHATHHLASVARTLATDGNVADISTLLDDIDGNDDDTIDPLRQLQLQHRLRSAMQSGSPAAVALLLDVVRSQASADTRVRVLFEAIPLLEGERGVLDLKQVGELVASVHGAEREMMKMGPDGKRSGESGERARAQVQAVRLTLARAHARAFLSQGS